MQTTSSFWGYRSHGKGLFLKECPANLHGGGCGSSRVQQLCARRVHSVLCHFDNQAQMQLSALKEEREAYYERLHTATSQAQTADAARTAAEGETNRLQQQLQQKGEELREALARVAQQVCCYGVGQY